jgi:hypothetical protein
VPSTVASLLAVAGLESGGRVGWGERVPETRTGVYLVSLTPTGRVANALTDCPLSDAALDELLSSCPALTLGGERPTRAQVAKRIGSYWLPDECVLYIGLAGQPLRTRVRQYYKTRIGAAKPHKGGWWLKTLSVLTELHVHYAPTDDFKDAEEQALRAFAAGVSHTTRAALPTGDPVMPFANLRDGDWHRKRHGIRGETSEATRSTGAVPKTTKVTRSKPSTAFPARTREAPVTPHFRSQRVTESDIKAGQVRIPIGATKTILPQERQDIPVLLVGRELTGRWDPRYGEKERSGVIRLGRTAARELLHPGDVLGVSMRADGTAQLS